MTEDFWFSVYLEIAIHGIIAAILVISVGWLLISLVRLFVALIREHRREKREEAQRSIELMIFMAIRKHVAETHDKRRKEKT